MESGTRVHVIGAGLAGSECAWQLAQRGHKVTLYEMRGEHSTPAHITSDFAELVCSNSFGSESEVSGTGQLKWEAGQMQSLILQTAQKFRVPAGQALSVDRQKFGAAITECLIAHPNISISRQKILALDQVPRPCVVATGPLTDLALAEDLIRLIGRDFLYFFDSIAPIISADSINRDIAWLADRYDKGTPDYLNCPLSKEEYFSLIEAIRNSRKIEPKHFETTDYFEGCMPIEEMVRRGPNTPRFGPMKPVGLTDPRTGRRPFAAVQLRTENRDFTAYNMVGFQTRMAYSEQQKVFRLIPGLENAEFLKLGSIHRNLYINSPEKLAPDLSWPDDPFLFFAGQITGVEGYFESASIGLLVGTFLSRKLRGQNFAPPPRASALGSLWHAISDDERIKNFQPTNINFGMFPAIEATHPLVNSRDKAEKRQFMIDRARSTFKDWLAICS